MRTGVAHLPLHYGKAPSWLFQKMKSLSREITLFIIDIYGVEEMLLRLSDPFWFQAFGCVLGFDWHSSGVTTTVCGALKEGIRGMEKELGFYMAGGKGKASRKTPQEIEEICDRRSINGTPLIYANRMSAKVDNAAVQDGHPYPVDRKVYDKTIEILKGAIENSRVGDREKVEAIRRLRGFTNISHRA